MRWAALGVVMLAVAASASVSAACCHPTAGWCWLCRCFGTTFTPPSPKNFPAIRSEVLVKCYGRAVMGAGNALGGRDEVATAACTSHRLAVGR